MVYRAIVYFIAANIAYFIFSLLQRGVKYNWGYIAELSCLLCIIGTLMVKGVSDLISLLVASAGFIVLVLAPIFLQHRINELWANGKMGDIEPLARLKSNIALTEINNHLHTLSVAAVDCADDIGLLADKMRSFLGRGEPFDSMTRISLGLLHLNSRNFAQLISDLRLEGKELSEQSFDELLFLVKAYLETADYAEALRAQLALEKLAVNDKGNSNEKISNALISRMPVLAYMGMQKELINLFNSDFAAIKSLQPLLKEFWLGVCVFYSGSFREGQERISKAISGYANNKNGGEEQTLFMQKKLTLLIDSQNCFEKQTLPQLKGLYEAYGEALKRSWGALLKENEGVSYKAPVSKALIVLITAVSIILMTFFNIEDTVDLVRIGANSSFLVKQYGEYFRLFTYNFIHIGMFHLLMNMAALYYFAGAVEAVLGSKLFLFVFVFSGIAGGYAAVEAERQLSAGASAAVLGLLAASIVLRLFKADKNTAFAKQSNLSALIFILVLNLIIGAAEEGIDNSAHIGGLIGGFVSTLILIVPLRFKLLKRIAGVVGLCAAVGVVLFSVLQIKGISEGAGFYPLKQGKYTEATNASYSIALDVPQGWALSEGDGQNLCIGGPFNEKAIFIIAYNSESTEKLLNDYIENGTKEIMSSTVLKLQKRFGPDKVFFKNKTVEAYRLCWLLKQNNARVSIVDYLLISKPIGAEKISLVVLAKFFLGTERSKQYEPLMRRIIDSIRLK